MDKVPSGGRVRGNHTLMFLFLSSSLPLSLKINKTFKKYLLICLFLGRGSEGERKRNINVWLPLMRPLLGTWPATQACSLTGNLTVTLWVTGPRLVHWGVHTSQGCYFSNSTNWEVYYTSWRQKLAMSLGKKQCWGWMHSKSQGALLSSKMEGWIFSQNSNDWIPLTKVKATKFCT